MAKTRTLSKNPLGEAAIAALLAKLYPAPEYAFLTQVRNQTGYSRASIRTADAVAFSLWPSRGLAIHGFEIKSHISDLRNELTNPEKAEEIAQYCDYWWVVLAADWTGLLNIPQSWGVMVVNEAQNGLAVVRQPTKLEDVQPISRSLVFAVFRRASQTAPDKVALEAAEQVGYTKGYADGKRTSTSELEHTLQLRNEQWSRLCTIFGSDVMLELSNNYRPEELRKRLTMARSLNFESYTRSLEYARNQAAQCAQEIQLHCDALSALANPTSSDSDYSI